MLQFLLPTRFKIIVALIVAISSFLSAEVAGSTKEEIWDSVSPNLNKDYLVSAAPNQGALSLSSGWQRVEAVSKIDKSNIEKALWLERGALLLIFIVFGYLTSCLIVTLGKHEQQI